MDGDHVSIPIEDQETWGRRRERLRALRLVAGPQLPGEFRFRVYPLLDAMKEGHVDKFIDAFENFSTAEGVTLPNILAIRGPSGNTLLHVAAGIENADILRALLLVIDDRQLPTQANDAGDTTLHVAARAGRIEAAKLLLSRGSIADNANDTDNTALHEELGRGSIVDIANDTGNTAQHEELSGNTAQPEELGRGGIADIANDPGNMAQHEELSGNMAQPEELGRGSIADSAYDMGSTAQREKLRFLHTANYAGNTALHEAVKNGDSQLTDLLLRQGSSAVDPENKEGKCPLYLAVETGNLEILKLLMEAMDKNEVPSSRLQGMSPVHGAVTHKRKDMLEEMLEQKKELFDSTDAGKGTPLHLAAYENYVDGVEFLVKKFTPSAFKHDKDGYFPIHVACKMGRLETIKVLCQHCPDPEELLTSEVRQNILHVAAKYGRASVVKYILGDPKFKKLINAKDKDGNTPLHVATEEWQPEVLFSLTRHKEVNLQLVNHDNLTALDIADERPRKFDAPLHQSLTRTILVSAGAPKSKDKAICQLRGLGPQRQPPDLDKLESCAEARMVVATLIAGVTFAAGFSVPGGYNSSEPDAGIATLLSKPMYDVFVICNSIAMYNSIIAVVILLWTQINDSHAMFHALRRSRLPLLIALATMSVAFIAGVYVTINKRTWIAVVALIVGITALFVILVLYIALFIPLAYKWRLVQLFANYIIRALISISRVRTEEVFERNPYGFTAPVPCYPLVAMDYYPAPPMDYYNPAPPKDYYPAPGPLPLRPLARPPSLQPVHPFHSSTPSPPALSTEPRKPCPPGSPAPRTAPPPRKTLPPQSTRSTLCTP